MSETLPMFTDDVIPDELGTTDPEPNRTDEGRVCRECQVPLPPYNKRGRKPVVCDDCKSSKSTSSKSPRENVAISRIRTKYSAHAYGLGGLLKFIDEFDGTVVQNNSANIGEICATAAASNSKIKRALESTSEASGWLQIGVGLSTIVYPILVHHGLIRVPEQVKLYMESQVLGRQTQPEPEGGLSV